jgi:translation initiation factor 4E
MTEESLDYDFTSIPSAHHALPEAWTFWFIRRPAVRSNDSYSKHLKMLGVVNSVEQFWAVYNHTVRPNDLPSPCDLQIFRHGVQPLWEDEANRLGGKLYFRVRKGQSSRMWEDMLLALIGGQFHGCGLCGAVISTRFSEDCISIWNKDARDEGALQVLRDTVRRVLKLRPGAARRACRIISGIASTVLLSFFSFAAVLFALCDCCRPACRIDGRSCPGVQAARYQPEQTGRSGRMFS